MPQDRASRRAECFAQADLARPARHGDHHDRHHADASYHQRDAGQHQHHKEEREGQAVEDTQDLVGREQIERVRVAHAQAPHPSQRQRGRIHGARDRDVRFRLYENDERVDLVDEKAAARGLERHDPGDLGGSGDFENVRGSLPHSHDPERMPADAHDAAERIDGPEQPVDRPLLDDHDGFATAHLGRGERAARDDAAAQNLHEPVIGAEDAEDAGMIAAVLEPLEELRPDRGIMDLGKPGDGLRLLRDQLGPDAHFARHRVGIHAGRREVAEHTERRRPDDLERIHDLLAESRNDGRHRHYRRDPDHHPQDGERGAQLVGAQLLEGDAPTLANRVKGHLFLAECLDRIEA